METQTTTKRKWKTWQKVTLSVIGFFFFMGLLGAILGPAEPSKKEVKEKIITPKVDYVKKWKDSIAEQIKKDTVYIVKDANFYNDTLRILLKRQPDDDEYFAKYFLTEYFIDSNKNITTCSLYDDYKKKPISSALSGWRVKEIIDAFVKKYFDSWNGSCKPVEEYLKENMNDADSYENVDTRYIFDQSKYTFRIIAKFRGTNVYGAKVLNAAIAEVDTTGTIVKITVNAL